MSRFLFLMPLVLVCGCGSGKKGPETVEVKGQIFMDGKPLANAKVHFLSKDFASFGETDSEGKYELVQGAVPGKNTVYISKIVGGKTLEGFSDDPADGLDSGQVDAITGADTADKAKPAAGEQIPAKYSNPEKTELSYTVPEGGSESANFKLKSK